MKDIIISKAAFTALNSLNTTDRDKAEKLIKIAAVNENDTMLLNLIYKFKGVETNMFAIKLGTKLRIIIQVEEQSLKVLDILNHDLFIRYFHNKS